jgi:hypothetical protein
MYKGKLTVPQWIQLRQIKDTNLSLNTLNTKKNILIYCLCIIGYTKITYKFQM